VSRGPADEADEAPIFWTVRDLEALTTEVDALAAVLDRQARTIRALQARVARLLAAARRVAARREGIADG
jgi:hypothetical protein